MPESLAQSHPGVIQEVTRLWRPLGVRIGLEHAGAALAGMTRLYQLGLDYVRIDARFLSGIADDAAVRRHAESVRGRDPLATRSKPGPAPPGGDKEI